MNVPKERGSWESVVKFVETSLSIDCTGSATSVFVAGAAASLNHYHSVALVSIDVELSVVAAGSVEVVLGETIHQSSC